MEHDEIDEVNEPATILVVEDDEETADFLRELLTEAGHTTVVAGSGEAALDLFESRLPDVIIVDLMLPGMDGYAITRHMRAGSMDAVPVIMLTAEGQEQSKLRGFESGVDDFIVKPFLAEELLARISVQLRQSRARQSLEDQSQTLRRMLDLMSSRHHEAETGLSLERTMRVDLLRSVNTHLQALGQIFDNEFRREPPGKGREALLRVIPRLRGAALVYQIADQLTGETADLGRLVRTIVMSVRAIHNPHKRINAVVEADSLEVPSAVASPLAMVISELVTNAFKHAFTDGRKGTVTVRCHDDPKGIQLEVIDNGIGSPATTEPAAQGPALVRQMVAELGGSLELTQGSQGTHVCVHVPVAIE